MHLFGWPFPPCVLLVHSAALVSNGMLSSSYPVLQDVMNQHPEIQAEAEK